MEKVPVTVAVIAKNEEKRLDECLLSVSNWAAEIVVVDDASTDRTSEIARKYTSRVLQRTMDIEGRQRNFAYAQSSQPWVLSLDADERVTPGLAEEIRTALAQAPQEVVCFAIPIKTFIGKQWIQGAGYYPASKTRLFRSGKFKYEEARVHPRALYEGKCNQLKGDILHYSCENLEQWLHKFNRETTLEAEKWILDGRRVSMFSCLRKSVDRFLKNYFLKEGWKFGFWGYTMSVFHGLYQLLSYAKYREALQKRSAPSPSATS
ncbi:MAG: hypothetical protein A2Z83_05065 [Omnitrophica bacterium GWA2_52_8]|nr:MAG: hypothetical protein A2Z83_05065 [Omnitrophica bacterium GWA2_52_8]